MSQTYIVWVLLFNLQALIINERTSLIYSMTDRVKKAKIIKLIYKNLKIKNGCISLIELSRISRKNHPKKIIIKKQWIYMN